MIEEVLFPYAAEGGLKEVKITLYGERVLLKAVIKLLGLSTRPDRLDFATPYKAPKVSDHTASLDDLDRWLRSLKAEKTKQPELTKHVQEHLVATLRAKSMNVVAVEAEIARQREEESSKVIMVNQPLDQVDHFRKEASTLAQRLPPTHINAAVHQGVMDVFLVEQDLFSDRVIVRHNEIPINDGVYRRNYLRDMMANFKALTGPQFQAKYPDHPLLKRRVAPAQPFYQVGTDNKPVLTTLPQREVPHRWERYLEN